VTGQKVFALLRGGVGIAWAGAWSLGDCGSEQEGLLALTGALYPVVGNYEWRAVPETGHCWQLH
jgi:hypothetical protein